MDLDQTAPQEQSDLGPNCFVYEASNILGGDRNIHFVIMCFKG